MSTRHLPHQSLPLESLSDSPSSKAPSPSSITPFYALLVFLTLLTGPLGGYTALATSTSSSPLPSSSYRGFGTGRSMGFITVNGSGGWRGSIERVRAERGEGKSYWWNPTSTATATLCSQADLLSSSSSHSRKRPLWGGRSFALFALRRPGATSASTCNQQQQRGGGGLRMMMKKKGDNSNSNSSSKSSDSKKRRAQLPSLALHHRRGGSSSSSSIATRPIKGGAGGGGGKREEGKGGEGQDEKLGVFTPKQLFRAATIAVPILLAVGVALHQSGAWSTIQSIDVGKAFEQVEMKVEELGPWGYVLFGAVYVLAEVLAVPAVPLTASSGYLFGLMRGTGVVVISATIAAAISFLIGRTLLRSTVEKWIDGNPRFKALDRAIGSEGFKIILLLRLSPIFPFALSNYMYGLTAVDFWPYFWATLVGFFPGTLAYVYSGTVGRSFTEGDFGSVPWYAYAGAAVGFGLLTKLISEIATRAIGEYEAAEGAENEI